MKNLALRIEININDPKKFGFVAFLVDKEEFLKDVAKLRKEWDINPDILKQESDNHHWELFPWSSVHLKSAPLKNKTKEDLDDLFFKLHDRSHLEQIGFEDAEKLFKRYEKGLRNNVYERFHFQIKDLRKKYKRPPNFDRVIAHAVLFGMVKADDLLNCSAEIILPETEYFPYFEDSKLVINLYPSYKREEVITLLDKRIPELLKEYEKRFVDIRLFEKDTIANIKRDREWYWKNKAEGMGYTKLAKLAPISWSGVRDAIKQYKQRLAL